MYILTQANIAYIGDDLADLPCIIQVKEAGALQDARMTRQRKSVEPVILFRQKTGDAAQYGILLNGCVRIK